MHWRRHGSRRQFPAFFRCLPACALRWWNWTQQSSAPKPLRSSQDKSWFFCHPSFLCLSLIAPACRGLCGSEAAHYVCTAHSKAVYGASGTRGNAGHGLADALTRLAVRPAEQKGHKILFFESQPPFSGKSKQLFSPKLRALSGLKKISHLYIIYSNSQASSIRKDYKFFHIISSFCTNIILYT